MDALLGGLGMSVTIVLILFSLMIMTSITESTRLCFLPYPVLFPFLVVAMLSLAPALFLIAVCGLFFRMYILRNSGSWTQLDTIYAGLAGTVLLQLVTFAAARAIREIRSRG